MWRRAAPGPRPGAPAGDGRAPLCLEAEETGSRWVSGKPESRAVTGGAEGQDGGSSPRPLPCSEVTARLPHGRVTVRAPSLPSGPKTPAP